MYCRLRQILFEYIEDEATAQKEQVVATDWNITDTTPYSPQQRNCWDCAIYVLMCIDFLVDNIPLDITLNDQLVLSPLNMPHFRRKICADLIRGKLHYYM